MLSSTWFTLVSAELSDLKKDVQNEKSDVLESNQFRRKFEFLLKHCCPTLRVRLVKHSHFRYTLLVESDEKLFQIDLRRLPLQRTGDLLLVAPEYEPCRHSFCT